MKKKQKQKLTKKEGKNNVNAGRKRTDCRIW